MLSPAFHFRILSDFVPIINEQSAVMVNSLSRVANQDIDIFDFIPYAALDIICETAMGVNIRSQSNPKTSYVKAVMLQSEVVFSRFFNPLMSDWMFYRTEAGKKHRKSIEMLHTFTLRVINEKIEERSRPGHVRQYDEQGGSTTDNLYMSGRKRLAFMDLLVDAYLDQIESSTVTSGAMNKIDIEGIREEVDTFMFEGFDTTAAAVSWIIFLLGHNQECQQRLYEELEQLLGNSGDSNAHIDQKCLSQFKYLEACVKEGLRLFPSVPMIGRRLTADLQFGPFKVPKNTTSVVYLYGLHRDPNTFPDPDRFLPDRFLGDQLHQRHAFAYLPFSAGQRNCIGQKFAQMETKIMLLYLVRNFHIESTVPLDQVSICIELITRPKSRLGVRFTPRTNQSLSFN
jgi:cytochrome P450